MEKDKKPVRSFDLDKKSVRSFDLDKKPARSFDLDKNDEAEAMPASDTKVGVGKNTRFDFNKTEEPAATTQSQPVSAEKPEFASEKKTHLVLGKKAVTVPTNQPQPTQNNPTESSTLENAGNYNEPKSRKWLWILLLAVLAGGALIWGLNRCEGGNADFTANQPTVAPTDSLVAEEQLQEAGSKVSSTDEPLVHDDKTIQRGGEMDQNEAEISKQGKITSDNNASAPVASSTQPNAPKEKESSSVTPSTLSNSRSVTAPTKEVVTHSRKETQPSSTQVTHSFENSSEILNNVPEELKDVVRDVFAGKYGNWPEREKYLGTRYKEVQKEVNLLYRSGLVNR